MPAMRRQGISGRAAEQLGRDPLDGFSNDCELSNDSILPMGLRHELSVAHCNIAFDLPNRVEHVLQIERVSTHRATASERTRSRR
jgi:hypothetical protein